MPADVQPFGVGDRKAKPRLRAVGIGGAGCNAISSCTFDAVALCNSQDGISTPMKHKRVVLTADHIHLLRSTSPRLLGTMDHDSIRQIKEAIGSSDLLFLFTGLGGETGSSLTPAVATLARKASGLIIASAALPFSVEGRGRQEAASKALPDIVDAAHLTITYPNDGLLRMTPNLPLRRAFKVMDEIMLIPAMELASVLTRDDITDLRADLVRCRHMRLGMGQGSGMRREELAVADAFTSPWLDFSLEKVELAIVVISAADVDPYAIKVVMDRLAYRIPNAKIRYAAKADPSLGNDMRVMLLLGYDG